MQECSIAGMQSYGFCAYVVMLFFGHVFVSLCRYAEFQVCRYAGMQLLRMCIDCSSGLCVMCQVDNLWEIAIGVIRDVMQEQFARMSTSQHMLLVKDDVSLLCASLRRYGFQVNTTYTRAYMHTYWHT